jgi:hypothetical protein
MARVEVGCIDRTFSGCTLSVAGHGLLRGVCNSAGGLTTAPTS